MRSKAVPLALFLLTLAACGGDPSGFSASSSSASHAASSGSGGHGGAVGSGGAGGEASASSGVSSSGSGGTPASGSGGAGGSPTASSSDAASSGETTSSTAEASSVQASSAQASSAASTGTGGPAACMPAQGASTDGGGRCADLKEAWTGRGINVGYYAYKTLQATPQYSGDYSGAPGAIFTPGATSKGVILQMIPAGAYVGLSSTGPNYDAPMDCFPTSYPCGSPNRSACSNDSPEQRPSVAGFAWGYAYSGASHMQGWIPLDPAYLEFAGHDPSHPCALGPAGLDFEVHAACGTATACQGTNPACGDVNPCSEGADDCGNTSCGAMSGGALTPSAWHKTMKKPAAHTCTTKTPPDPSVKCLANGSDQDFFFVYPFGAYAYWAQNSTTKYWLHYDDAVTVYFHNRDAEGVLWDFVEVTSSGAPVLTPKSDGSGAGGSCSSSNPAACTPCKNGGACGWVQDVFVD